jgi:hypothetical protein
MPRDPRRSLVRLLARLEERGTVVTRGDVERATRRRPSATLPTERVDEVMDAALDEGLVLSDRRTFFDRETATFSEAYIYRVNRRHPLAREILS